MSENFQSEKEEEKEILNGAEQEQEAPQEAEEETIEAKLAKSEAEIEDLKDRLLRQMAEFDNYRKRTMKEKAEIILNGSAGVVTDILPVIDDLERAVANSAKSEDYNALKEGVELIYNKLMHILEQKGLQKISPKPFERIYDWAAENNIGVRHHTFVWYSQTPAWFFTTNNLSNHG